MKEDKGKIPRAWSECVDKVSIEGQCWPPEGVALSPAGLQQMLSCCWSCQAGVEAVAAPTI